MRVDKCPACSFCKLSLADVPMLIASAADDAWICDQCIAAVSVGLVAWRNSKSWRTRFRIRARR
jgi:hypothetical protein